MSYIFVSYSRKDINFAQKIVNILADNKLDTWIDWKSIPKGEDWEQEIYHGIEGADVFLFLISPDSVTSQMCKKEIAYAVKNGKRILPIVIRDTELKDIHTEISKRNWIFCRDGQDDFIKAIEETLKTIHTDYEWLKYHTKLQVKALDWKQTKDNSRLLRGKELREAKKKLAEINSEKTPQPTNLQRKFILSSQRHEKLSQGSQRSRTIEARDIQQSILITGDNAQVTVNHLSHDNAQLSSSDKKKKDENLKPFIEWELRHNATFSIPNLDLSLPISKAWARLTAINLEETDKSDKLSELIKHINNYREWYELARDRHNISPYDIEKIAHQNRLLVIIGGPGSGKSTLLRRLAYGLLQDGYLALRVSLRTVALRMKKGETFDEAIIETALDGFTNKDVGLSSFLINCDYLLADGLDETGEDRLMIASYLQKWASSRSTLKVVVTTRPVGYNPSWLTDWNHFELLPLKQENVHEFVATIFELLYQNDAGSAKKKRQDFSKEIDKSKIANIAVRNPQLLGFLLALFNKGQDLTGNRSQLFEKIIDEIRQQTRLDKEFLINTEKAVANFVIEHLGYLLLNAPSLSENEIEDSIGKSLSQQLGISSLQSRQMVIGALKFWEERGLIERLNVGTVTVFVFIHTAFQEFLAARWLEKLSDKDLINWILEAYSFPVYREPILLLGGTKRLDLVVQTLLETKDIDDPISTAAILTAGVLAEAEHIPSSLFDGVFNHLLTRLTSDIPTIVDETVSTLIPIAEISPELVGPIAIQLSTHQNVWIVEAATILGLIAGEQYVNLEALLSIYLIAGEYSRVPSADKFGRKFRGHIRPFIIKGAQYLNKYMPSEFKEIVIERYNSDASLSMGTMVEFESFLQEIFSPKEFSELRKLKWEFDLPDINKIELQHRKEWHLILTAILTALQDYQDQKLPSPDKYFGALSRLYCVLEIGETPATDMPVLLKTGLSNEFIEVIRDAISISEISPLQLRADAEKALSLIENQTIRSFEIISSMELQTKVEINWKLIRNHRVNIDLLLQALRHPVWFVCRFAALLLLEFAELMEVKSGLRNVIKDSSEYTIRLIAHIASDIWGSDAGKIVLEHLEVNFTDECAPLVEILGSITPSFLTERASTMLVKALKSKDVEMVKAAIAAIENLNLFDTLYAKIRAKYLWWLRKGPQSPEKSGVVPENAAKYLFECLNSHHRLKVSDIKEAAMSKRSDVQEVAIKAIGNLCTQDNKYFKSVLHDIENNILPKKIINELEKSHLPFCALHIDDFMLLLESDNLQVKTKVVQMFGNKTLRNKSVEEKLRLLLISPQIELRDNALHSLRKLTTE